MDQKDSLLAPATTFALFDDAKIRRERHEGEWYYSIVDIVSVLTGSERADKYRSDLKSNLISEGGSELSAKIGNLNKKRPHWCGRFRSRMRCCHGL